MEKDASIIQGIINKSGHDFHLKISQILKEKGWKVQNSPHYNDPITNIAREIDIIAEKNYPVSEFGSGKTEELIIRLFIECKYINKHIVFWFLEKDLDKAKILAKNNLILRDKEDCYLETGGNVHHYVQKKEVVKEFSSQDNSQILDKAQNQILNATLFFSKNQKSNSYTIDYPVIIVNSFDKFKKKIENKSDYEDMENNFEMEVEYTYQNNPEYFLIDIISEKTLDTFFDNLESNDVKMLRDNLGFDIRRKGNQKKPNNRRLYIK